MLLELWSWFLRYFFNKKAKIKTFEETLIQEKEAKQIATYITGDVVIDIVRQFIKNRYKFIMLSGTRGGGKSYCCEQAIRQSIKKQNIGGWRMIQGNMETPRELLSERMIVIDENGKPKSEEALALSPIGVSYIPEKLTWEYAKAKKLSRGSYEFCKDNWDNIREFFPAIPCSAVDSLQTAEKFWNEQDWWVLFLDELNRFGSGFLDSLFSLTEERIIIRRGESFYVPIMVLATCNPPGYDNTSKKLPPPLQARQMLQLRLSNPTHNMLAEHIIPPKIIAASYDDKRYKPDAMIEYLYLSAACTLCLWGDPASKNKGLYYLCPETVEQLKTAMKLGTPSFRRAMKTLSSLVEFGVDARAAADWMLMAIERAVNDNIPLNNQHLLDTALPILSHKVRENFNEGAEPNKVWIKEHCISEIVHSVLTQRELRNFFLSHFSTIKSLCGDFEEHPNKMKHLRQVSQIVERAFEQIPASRRIIWYEVLSLIPEELHEKALLKWKNEAIRKKALTKEGCFFNKPEMQWFIKLFQSIRKDSDSKIFSEWGYKTIFVLEEELERDRILNAFAPILGALCKRYGQSFDSVKDCSMWLEMISRILTPATIETHKKDYILWRTDHHLLGNTEEAIYLPTNNGILLKECSDEVIYIKQKEKVFTLLQNTFTQISYAANLKGKKRCRKINKRLEILSEIEDTMIEVANAICKLHKYKPTNEVYYIFRSGLQKLFIQISKRNLLDASLWILKQLKLVHQVLKNENLITHLPLHKKGKYHTSVLFIFESDGHIENAVDYIVKLFYLFHEKQLEYWKEIIPSFFYSLCRVPKVENSDPQQSAEYKFLIDFCEEMISLSELTSTKIKDIIESLKKGDSK